MEMAFVRRSLQDVRNRWRDASETHPFVPSDEMPERSTRGAHEGTALTYEEFCFAYQQEQHLKRHRKKRNKNATVSIKQ